MDTGLGPRTFVLLALALAGFTAGSGWVAAKEQRAPRRDEILPARPPEARPRPTFGWYGDVPPTPVDVDGKPALVGLVWHRGSYQLGLHAVAFDRASRAPRWIAGPYPSVVPSPGSRLLSLVVRDGRIVLLDAEGTVHVLDRDTGAETGSTVLPTDAHGVCLESGGERVFFGEGALLDAKAFALLPLPDRLAEKPLAFDPKTLKLTAVAPTATRLCRSEPSCDAAHVDRCAGGVPSVSQGETPKLVLASRFDVPIPFAGPASTFGFVWSDRRDVLVHVDDDVLVFEAQSGAFRGKLTAP